MRKVVGKLRRIEEGIMCEKRREHAQPWIAWEPAACGMSTCAPNRSGRAKATLCHACPTHAPDVAPCIGAHAEH